MAKRFKICRKVKGKKTKSCSYVVRDKNGRFKRWTNIGKSIRADARTKSKTRPRKPGYGHRGDY